MHVTAQMVGESGQQTFKGPIPPHARLRNFFAPDLHGALLQWVMDQEPTFRPAKVNRGKPTVDPDMRIAATTRDLGALQAPVEAALLAAVPDIRAKAGIGGPIPEEVELELAAHGDAAHFRPHIDVLRGPDGSLLGKEDGEVRLLSAVYYFHNEPKGFSGGALRLYRMGLNASDAGDDPNNFLDLEPEQNSLVVFPSWTLHEVRPVSVSSGRFIDYRFALNCWFCASLEG